MNEPPVLVSQQGVPSVPSGNTLDEAVLWDYSYTSLLLLGDTPFEVTFNDDRTESYTMTLEDADGIAQVRVTASAGALPLVVYGDTELVPVDGAYQYRMADGSLLTFVDASEMRNRIMVTIPRLDVLDVQSARATIGGHSFAEPFLPFIENDQPIALGGAPASIAAHLNGLLQMLLANSPFASQPMAIECRYGYAIGGLPIEAPVVLVTRQDVAIGFAEELVEMIASSIQQWLEAVKPPATDAELIFTLTFWSALPRTDATLLRLARVTLPMTSVVL